MKKQQRTKPFYFTVTFVLLFSFSIFSQTTHNITNPNQLSGLTLDAGDTVVLADGTYSSDERIKFSPSTGTVNSPITFRSLTPGGVKFTGGLQIDIGGDYVIVDGFHWKGGYGASNFIQFRDGSNYANYSTIQNCAIDGLTVNPNDEETGTSVKHRWIVLYGTHNTVINCSFMNKTNAGATVLVELQYNGEDDPCAIVGHTISNNYFYKYSKTDTSLTNAGDSETIRLGSSGDQNVNSNTKVSNNYFVEADGENEIITNKSKNNIFINNTFRRCRGSLVLRHGSDALVDGNYFLGEDVEGTGGIRITDSNHIITNNYIQDCINVNSQAQWNNGITFIGGGDNNAVLCTSANSTNGYQKVENIILSNNTIVNTNSPLYYNTSKGSTDPTGTVENNLIYFAESNSNITSVINGNYNELGTVLTYAENIYSGTDLGFSTLGFSEETGITANAVDEIFTFSGTGSEGKGADMGSYIPTIDAMVGYGIGTCFLNNLGVNINDGDCTIVISESLIVSNLPSFASDASSSSISVTANVNWTAISNDAWVSIDVNSGNGDETISVSVVANTTTSSRVGTITFTGQGDDDIVRDINVIQVGVDVTDLYNLINDVSGGGPVSILEFSSDNASKSPPEIAINTLDKINTSQSIWAADDGAVLAGDYKGDGEYIIYDLGAIYDLDLIQFSTTSKSDSFGFEVWTSTIGTDLSNFSRLLPIAGDLLFTRTNTMDFNQYEIEKPARYIKIIGYGRYNSLRDTRTSVWSTIAEIEFFGDLVLSVDNFEFNQNTLVYPIPTEETLNVKLLNNAKINSIKLFSMDGKLVLDKDVDYFNSDFSIDIRKIKNGTYILNLSNGSNINNSRLLIISH